MSHIIAAAAATLLSAAPLMAAPAAPASTAQTAKGPALVDAKGMTLYTFDKDMGDKSACNGTAPATGLR